MTVYHGDLDGTGHVFGVASDAWYNQLAHVDKLAEQLAGALPAGTIMYVTADHGMVDISPEDKFDVDAHPELRSGLALLGGEPRARHLYARRGAAADLLAAWREALGDRAWVLSRDEAISEGWFGPVDAAMTSRIGDVVAAPARIARPRRHPGRAARVPADRHARLADPRGTARASADVHRRVNTRDGRDGLLISCPGPRRRAGAGEGARAGAGVSSTRAGGWPGHPASTATSRVTCRARSSPTWTGTWPACPGRPGPAGGTRCRTRRPSRPPCARPG